MESVAFRSRWRLAHRVSTAVLVALAIVPSGTYGRTIDAWAQTFRAKTALVTIPVNVTNLAGTQSIAGLSSKSFRVFEDGVEQQIAVVDSLSRPISLCILIDSSYSMSGVADIARSSVEAIVERLRPDDEFTVMQFSQDVDVLVPWSIGPRQQVNWSRYKLALGSNIVASTKMALGSLSAAQRERTAVLLISDGKEFENVSSVHSLAETRRQTEALVYALQPHPLAPESGEFVRARNYLSTLVGDSGGAVYRVLSSADAHQVARALLGELHSAYVIGYESTRPPDGKYRQVRVTVNYDDLRVRHRAGYLATPD